MYYFPQRLDRKAQVALMAALRDVMPKLLNVTPWASLALAKPGLQRFGLWRRLRRDMDEADRLLYAEIADRRSDPDLATRTDALAMLVRAADGDGATMSDKELRDQLMTLLVAGHDTTATGLSWALERLTRHPAVLDKAVRAAESVASMSAWLCAADTKPASYKAGAR